MANPTELLGSGTIRYTRQGMTGTREILCDWDDRLTYAPKPGDTWPGESSLKCVEVEISGFGVPESTTYQYKYDKAKIIAQYSTAQWLDSAPTETWEYGGEILETGIGRTWQNAGTYVQVSQGVFYPTMVRTVRRLVTVVPGYDIFLCMGRVNWQWFQGFPPETLLFEGCSTEQQWDYERQLYIYTLNLKFHYRMVPWNIVWRSPKQALDEYGNPRYDLTTNEPIYATDLSGTGGWDRPIPALYEVADFSPLLGLAKDPPPKTYQSYYTVSTLTADYAWPKPQPHISGVTVR